jgi:FkbM family methyltransferase
MNLTKPWYVYRPSQIVRRLYHSVIPGPRGVRPIPLPWGGTLKADTAKNMGRSLLEAGIYEIATSEVIARLLRPGDLALDVGAHVGYMTVLMGRRAGPDGRVLAFEPHPDLFRLLRENRGRAREAPSARVELHNEAVGEATGHALLVVPPEFETNDGLASLSRTPRETDTVISVDVVALDDVVGDETVRVLKLDVEGHELSALKGAARLIETHAIQHLVFEEHTGPNSAVCAFLRERGYTLFEIGWSLHGPELADFDGASITKPYEAPNYLATCDPDDALACCRSRGWCVLGRTQARAPKRQAPARPIRNREPMVLTAAQY